MRRSAHSGHIALTLSLVTVGLLALGVTAAATGLFGDANPVGVAMFLGLFVGVPAAVCGILVLLSLAAAPVRRPPADPDQYLKAGDIPGTCPNCEATISLDSVACPNCSASFGDDSVWRVRNSVQSSPGTHA